MITLEDWQTGRYREFPEFKTQEGYYKAVDALVEAYGEPTEKDADKWTIKSHRMYPIPLLDAFFNAGTPTEDSLTD